MKEGYSKWDATEFLDSEEAIAAYLSVTLEEDRGDPAALTKALGAVARARAIELLERINATLEAHGKIDAGTPLAVSIRAFLTENSL